MTYWIRLLGQKLRVIESIFRQLTKDDQPRESFGRRLAPAAAVSHDTAFPWPLQALLTGQP